MQAERIEYYRIRLSSASAAAAGAAAAAAVTMAFNNFRILAANIRHCVYTATLYINHLSRMKKEQEIMFLFFICIKR